MPALWKSRTLLIVAGTAGYWVVIFVGTHMPGNETDGGGHRDKVLHFGAFFGLAMLLCSCAACFRRTGPALYAGVVGLAAGYGIFDEWTQMLAKNRSADPLDWLADISGAIAGTLIFAL
ncbi:MAG: VanZ family protein, partial [Pirellulaceae bacterium]|nr:VanZ family protein [Pirellulaceae bacterium]